MSTTRLDDACVAFLKAVQNPLADLKDDAGIRAANVDAEWRKSPEAEKDSLRIGIVAVLAAYDGYREGEPPECIGCGEPVQRGQFGFTYSEGEISHADCTKPWAITEDPEAVVLLGDPIIYRSIAPEAPAADAA